MKVFSLLTTLLTLTMTMSQEIIGIQAEEVLIKAYDASGLLLTENFTSYNLNISNTPSSYHINATLYIIGNDTLNDDTESESINLGFYTSLTETPLAVTIRCIQEFISEQSLSKINYIITLSVFTNLALIQPFCEESKDSDNYDDPLRCPVLYTMNSPYVADLANQEKILSLDPFLLNFTLTKGYVLQDDFIQNVFYQYNTGTTWKAIPLASDTRILLFNASTFSEYGIKPPPPYGNWTEWSWDVLVDLALNLSIASQSPSFGISNEFLATMIMIRKKGGYLFSYNEDAHQICQLDNKGALTDSFNTYVHRMIEAKALHYDITVKDKAGNFLPEFLQWMEEPATADPLRDQPMFNISGKPNFANPGLYMAQAFHVRERSRFLNGDANVRIGLLPDTGIYSGRAVTITSKSNPDHHDAAWQLILKLLEHTLDYSAVFASPPPFYSLADDWEWVYAEDAFESETLKKQWKNSVPINYPFLGFTQITDIDKFGPFRYPWMEMYFKNATPEASAYRTVSIMNHIFAVTAPCNINVYIILLGCIAALLFLVTCILIPVRLRKNRVQRPTRMPFKVDFDLSKSLDSDEHHYEGYRNISGTDVNDRVIRFKDIIGHGSSCTVYKGVWGGKECAIKQYAESHYVDAEKELTVLLALPRNEYVVGYIGMLISNSSLLIAMDYMQNGNLLHYLKSHICNDTEKKAFILDAAKGLSYLHEKNITHGDFACRNLLLDNSNRVRVADFGMSHTSTTNEKSKSENVSGDIRSCAPELLKSNSVPNLKTDVYAFGMVCIEILNNGVGAYADLQSHQIIQLVTSGKTPIQEENSSDFAKLINSCLETNSKSRPSMKIIVEALYAIP